MLRQHSSIKGAKTHATMDNVIGALKSIKAQEFELEENLDPVLGISYSLDGKWIGITRYSQLFLPEMLWRLNSIAEPLNLGCILQRSVIEAFHKMSGLLLESLSVQDHVLLQAITPEISTSVTSYDQRFRGYVIWCVALEGINAQFAQIFSS